MTGKTVHFVSKPKYTAVRKNKVVRLRYALFDDGSNRTLEYRDDLYYLHGGYGGAFPKVEAALEGLEVGMKAELTLAPDEAFGAWEPDLVLTVPAAELPPEGRRVGVEVDGETPDGHVVKFRVTEAGGETLTLDGNHPYAGLRLRFHLEVLDIRDATPRELELGHAVRDPAALEPDSDTGGEA